MSSESSIAAMDPNESQDQGIVALLRDIQERQIEMQAAFDSLNSRVGTTSSPLNQQPPGIEYEPSGE
jgi:hypothetical protein